MTTIPIPHDDLFSADLIYMSHDSKGDGTISPRSKEDGEIFTRKFWDGKWDEKNVLGYNNYNCVRDCLVLCQVWDTLVSKGYTQGIVLKNCMRCLFSKSTDSVKMSKLMSKLYGVS